MLIKEPLYYFSAIRKRFRNSYLAEDIHQIIIGIDCDYFDAYSHNYTSLQANYQQQTPIAPFAGLFGVLGYESIHFFENIPTQEQAQYEFPAFVFANAKAYLHYSKVNKVYSFYGDEVLYFNFLEEMNAEPLDTVEKPFYHINTDLNEEQIHFYKIVEKAKEYLRAGDIFQVVLSEQLCLESNLNSLEFYKLLSKANPSPYMFFFPTPYGEVVGSSPEILVEMNSETMYIAPIAGTRPRGKDANDDARLAQELLADPKECSEHRMLVDLARNDIGRFAEKGTVQVKNMMHIKQLEHVMHIVTDVYGRKRKEVSLFEVIGAVFPAGTLSGAPKIRAMEIIAELEKYRRNVYGGGIGFLHFNGNVQLAIVIRSAFFEKTAFEEKEYTRVFIQAGAGVVYDSIPEKEYAEIQHKRASVVKVFEKNCNLHPQPLYQGEEGNPQKGL
ncbi:anthranilate synthase component I family protein [Capnocytophaga sputigena]|uniref:anthranilate synthase component I family protein n=2 Tax=Capnocytophaga sputigena TaxID=1019 RepID=UPI00248E1BAD|nr:anthranilate synthase component I family protein [Capnocytophaga sputigena]